ncbi:MAG: potassium-transporting ATPase subunit KdpC [Syntrophales bacterium]|nr:potassium-transporting ATPase subunit KdpC [Syntrophales bacterium]MDD5642168.1 potassium-transporting ATPase subunit KdpC [Syntrophales bacterium]
MRHAALTAVRVALVTLLLTGVAYPLLVTGLAQLLFPHQANGSLVQDDQGRLAGSALIGQRFSHPVYFQPRPSAAGEQGYDSLASGGSNFGPTSQKLRDRAISDLQRLKKDNPEAASTIPAELVTTSASGLDPHLSLAGAMWQLPRVAKARGIAAERIAAVVRSRLEGPDLGFLGEPRVNVLLLNLALDRQFGMP